MPARITGELRTWHKATLDFVAPMTFSESADTFRDYRLDVTFTNARTGETLTVPGFFAADGDAADTGASEGRVWRVNFNPPSEGTWTYTASFRTGNDIAASLDARAGVAVEGLDGEAGRFVVAPTNKTGDDFRAKGMILQGEDSHYLQHQGDDDYFVRGGPGVPENFLASRDIDNTPTGRHDYATHLKDFNAGDPTWSGGQGKAMLGAINYLAEQGQNSMYVMLLTAGGDGKDVWPWAATDLQRLPTDTARLNPSITSVYDVSKLAQWEILFDHMDAKGIYKNLVLQERENDNLLDGGTAAAGSSLSVERLIYMREMIARFGHANGLQWNLGEENSNSARQRADMAEWAKAVDPYDHLVVAHSWPSEVDQVYRPLLGEEAFDGTSLQASAGHVRARIAEYLARSAAAGDPWVLGWDEDSSGNSIIPAYSNNPDSTNERTLREALWGTLTAGGSGVSWYVKGASGHSYDQNMDTFDGFRSIWTWTAAATDFFNDQIPFWRMAEHDELTQARGDFVMADPGETYVVYLPYGAADDVRLDLTAGAGTSFDVFWYNPRTGGRLLADGQVDGGALRPIDGPPSDAGKDWVLLLKANGAAPTPDPDPANAAPVARDDSASVREGHSLRLAVLANDTDPDGDRLGVEAVTQAANGRVTIARNGEILYTPDNGFSGSDSFSYTVSDGHGGRDTATVRVDVGGAETGKEVTINAGGGVFAGTGGLTFLADRYVSGGRSYSTDSPITGTSDDRLYQSERYGDFSYSVPIADGSYTVTLKFAEIYFDAAGQRVFDVMAEGRRVLNDFDIWKSAGGHNIAHDVDITVSVTDGRLDLEFLSVIDNAKVNGIVISARGEAEPDDPSPTPSGNFRAPFSTRGPSYDLGDVFLFGFGSDDAPAPIGRAGNKIGVGQIGSDSEVDFHPVRGGESERIGIDFGRAADGVKIALDGLSSVGRAQEAAILTTYDAAGREQDTFVLNRGRTFDLDFEGPARYAVLEAGAWLTTGKAPPFDPDFSLRSVDPDWL
ncbi:malectin domain-containing carbohydrate-binding protein [Rubellimicrobium arenae]|uniref:malectin domain-containing carbohydrate-binding protein n=1 Tax=Rubellimicrobium arenae TaxID=2817372 RepID=UPI001B30F752|nr:malectin domain-containing carbohydrate-binding protein [Rubellimicrobium arenae]